MKVGYSKLYDANICQSSLIGHVRQRTRWSIGNVQTANKLNYRLWGPHIAGCTFKQRLAGFTLGAGSIFNCTLTSLGFVGLPLALLSGHEFVAYQNSWQLSWLLRLAFIWVFPDWLHKAVLSLFVGYRDGMRWDQAESWLYPCKPTLSFWQYQDH